MSGFLKDTKFCSSQVFMTVDDLHHPALGPFSKPHQLGVSVSLFLVFYSALLICISTYSILFLLFQVYSKF